jgi:hypothetical protein
MPSPAPIELRLRDVNEFFDPLDPSPFPERDLDGAAARFIRESMEDLGPGGDAVLVLHLPAGQLDQAPVIAQALRRYFVREREASERQLRQTTRFARFALLAGLAGMVIVVAISRALAAVAAAGTLTAALAESLTIVAWVFLWRPTEVLLFDRWGIRQRIRLHERLAKLPVRCVGQG